MNFDISIVIVSMNNPHDLINCIKSINKFNKSLRIEICVVFFNYSDDNKLLVENEKFINLVEYTNNGIIGFSENNNVALRNCKGKYLLVLNDDTYFDDNSIEELYKFSVSKQYKIVSPILLNFDKTFQFTGRPKFHLLSFLLHELKLQNLLPKIYKQEDGHFLTYNISGACFMIEANFFKTIGYFDEDYFFTPEDIAVGTISRRLYNVYPVVLENTKVYHKGSSTSKKIMAATLPTAKQGVFVFYGKVYGKFYELLARSIIYPVMLSKYLFWSIKNKSEKQQIMLNAFKNSVEYNFVTIPPKILFETIYKDLVNIK